MTLQKQIPSWYKWVIVAVCFLMVSICLGFCSSTKSLYLKAITSALNIERSLFSINDSCRYITTAVTNLFFGAMIIKLGPRKMITMGFTSLILSCLVYSFAESMLVFYLGGALLGFGLSMTTTTMVGYIVNIWCKEQKGTIMGLVLCSNGFGGAVATQILGPIIRESAFAYRTSYRLVALVLLIVGIIVVSLFRNSPQKGAALPTVEKKKAKGTVWSGITFEEALRKPYFYIACVCIFLTGMSLQGINGVYVPHLKDIGLDEVYVDGLLSLHSLTLAGFKFLTGVIHDKKGLRTTMLICDGAAIGTALLLAFVTVGPVGNALAAVYAFLAPLALPLETIMLPLIASNLFGEKEFAKLLGIFVAINTAGYAVGAPLANAIYDLMGTYVPVFFAVAIVMTCVAIAFMFVLNMSKKEQEAAKLAAE